MATFKSGEITFNGDGTASYANGFRGSNKGTLDFAHQFPDTPDSGQYAIQGKISSVRSICFFVLQPNKSKTKLYATYVKKDNSWQVGYNNANVDIKRDHYFVVRNDKVYGVAFNQGGSTYIYNILNGNVEDANNTNSQQTVTSQTASTQTASTTDTASTQTASTTDTASTQTASATTTTPQYKYVARKYNEISQVQQILKDKGLYNDKIDGQVGPNTAKALLKYVQDTENRQHVQQPMQTTSRPEFMGSQAAPVQGSPIQKPGQLQEVKDFYSLLDRMKDVF